MKVYLGFYDKYCIGVFSDMNKAIDAINAHYRKERELREQPLEGYKLGWYRGQSTFQNGQTREYANGIETIKDRPFGINFCWVRETTIDEVSNIGINYGW